MLLNKENLDPRVQRTHQLLIDAFITLLSEKTYSEISVKEIATRATVNRTTFYAHFIDKKDLFRYFCRKSFERMLSDQLSDANVSNQEYLSSLLTAVFEYMDWLADNCRSAKRGGEVSPPEAQVQIQLQDLILSWIKQLQYEERDIKVAPEVLAVAISSAMIAVARNWSRKLIMDRPKLEEMKRQLQLMITASLKAASIHAF